MHLQNGYYQGVNERRFRLNFNVRIRISKSDRRISYGRNGNIITIGTAVYYNSFMNNIDALFEFNLITSWRQFQSNPQQRLLVVELISCDQLEWDDLVVFH